jgi:hypothetical protein
MKYRLISLFTAQIARLLGLVRYVEPVQLEGQSRPEWALLVRGRGFTRILRDQPLLSPSLLRTVDPTAPRPMRFLARRAAVGYAQSVGLLKQQLLWTVRGN